jgi:hypothetical protein
MMPENPIATMRRTMFNLEFIDKRCSDQGPYETTQLVNSFLGALAHPWERLRTDLDQISLDEAHKRGWPKIVKTQTSDKEPKNLGQLIAWTRHAFAHGNVNYYADAKGVIDTVEFWNEKDLKNGKRRIWGTRLNVEDLRAYLEGFVALAIEIDRSQQSSK